MSILNSVLKVFVGDKNKKDLKQLQPIVDSVRAFDQQMENATIDEIRAKTDEFKAKISEANKVHTEKLSDLNTELAEAHIDRKEEIYKEIDAINEEIYETTEGVLNEIQSEAFALIKETAKRFTNNTSLKVKASPFDRELSGMRDHISLDGDYAI